MTPPPHPAAGERFDDLQSNVTGPEGLARATEGLPRPLTRPVILREVGDRELQVAAGRWISIREALQFLEEDAFADGSALADAAGAVWGRIVARAREP